MTGVGIAGFLMDDLVAQLVVDRAFTPFQFDGRDADGQNPVAGVGDAARPLLGEDHRAPQVVGAAVDIELDRSFQCGAGAALRLQRLLGQAHQFLGEGVVAFVPVERDFARESLPRVAVIVQLELSGRAAFPGGVRDRPPVVHVEPGGRPPILSISSAQSAVTLLAGVKGT